MKKQNGITLIALIITIIVMLILVGVTVNVALNGGLFNITEDVARRTERAAWREHLQAEITAMNAKIYADSDAYTFDIKEEGLELCTMLLNELEKRFELDAKYIYEETDGDEAYRFLNYEQLYLDGYLTKEMDHMIIPCEFEGKELKLHVEIEKEPDTSIIEIKKFYLTNSVVVASRDETVEVEAGGNVKEVTEDGVPIPKGFYYVTGTKDTGVVISDHEDDENNMNGTNGNQYVWVPVNTNPKLNIELEPDTTTIQEVRILNTSGYDETIAVNSDYFQKTIELEHNDTYEVIVKYADGTTEDIIEEVNPVYEVNNGWYTSVETLAILSEMTVDQMFEQIKTSLLDADPTLVLDTKISILKAMESQFREHTYKDNVSEAEMSSVLKYGGFYIGRYEGSSAGVKKSQTPTHTITYENAKSRMGNSYTDSNKYGVTADLPSGAAWDAIGNWLVKTEDKTKYEVYIDSTTWGNFRKYINNKEYSLRSTGVDYKYEANNIYDLVGNVAEWTKEVEIDPNTDPETIIGNVARGDHYNGLTFSTFNSRETNPEINNKIGGRPMLYINE